jgi:hypothetical protein
MISKHCFGFTSCLGVESSHAHTCRRMFVSTSDLHEVTLGMELANQEGSTGGPRGPRTRPKPLRFFETVNDVSDSCDFVGGRGLSANATAVDSRGRVCVEELDTPTPQVGSHGLVIPATVAVGFELLCLV